MAVPFSAHVAFDKRLVGVAVVVPADGGIQQRLYRVDNVRVRLKHGPYLKQLPACASLGLAHSDAEPASFCQNGIDRLPLPPNVGESIVLNSAGHHIRRCGRSGLHHGRRH